MWGWAERLAKCPYPAVGTEPLPYLDPLFLLSGSVRQGILRQGVVVNASTVVNPLLCSF